MVLEVSRDFTGCFLFPFKEHLVRRHHNFIKRRLSRVIHIVWLGAMQTKEPENFEESESQLRNLRTLRGWNHLVPR